MSMTISDSQLSIAKEIYKDELRKSSNFQSECLEIPLQEMADEFFSDQSRLLHYLLRKGMISPQNIATYSKRHHRPYSFENDEGEPNAPQSGKVGLLLFGKYIGKARDYYHPMQVRNPVNDFAAKREGFRVWWINHATTLIQIGDRYIITDPIFDEYAAPVPVLIKRTRQPPCCISDLPPISYILLSHDHWDHCCYNSLKQICILHPDAIVFAPLVLSNLVSSWGFPTVSFDWRQQLEIDQIKITCFPARHAANRYAVDFKERLWCSFLLEHKNVSIYFPGDTGIGPHFQEIREYVGKPIDLAMMPIGPQEPSSKMRAVHLNPKDVVEMSKVLEAKVVFPIHWGTFGLGLKPEVNDITLLKQYWESGDLHILKNGGCLEYDGEIFKALEDSHFCD